MSERWPGGLINRTAPTPSGGGAQDSAPGVWTLDQAAPYIASKNWPGLGTPDPQFQYVTALLHGDGTNAAQNNTFLDSSSNNFTITRNGNTTQGSFSPYGSLWGNYFPGSSSYLTAPNNSAFDFGSGDFTVELWYYPQSSPNTSLITRRASNGSYAPFMIQITSSNTLIMYASTSGSSWAVNVTSSVSFTLGTWNHIAMVRYGTGSNNCILYLNGVNVGSGSLSNTALMTNSSGVAICADDTGGSLASVNGYVSNVRLVKGTAIYTGAFTPPTAPLTAVSGTSLLTCQSNRFIDNSSNAFALTVGGTPSVQRFSPFQNLATYQTAKIGGSMYTAESVANYITAPSVTISGDFTMECWVYPISIGTSYTFQAFTVGNPNAASGFEVYGLTASPYSYAWYTNGSRTGTTYPSTVFLNTWTHIAAVRSGSTITFYANGVVLGTQSNSNTFSGTLTIGSAMPTFSDSASEYVSNFRFVNGTAVYTSAFTPPTAPVTAVTNTALLCNFTNGAIYDNAEMNDLQTVGSAQISTSTYKYGTGSIYCNSTGNYLSAPSSPNMYLGGNFTIECWVYPTANAGSSNSEIASYGASGQFDGWHFYQIASTNVLGFGFNYSGVIVSSSNALTLNTWSHVAVSRVGTTYLLFINGNQVGSATSGTTQSTNASDLFRLGTGSYSQGADRSFTGYIDDFRITNGYARYWSNFAAPSAAYPNYGGTLQLTYDPQFYYNTLLLSGEGTNGAQNNTFLDSSSNAFTITRNGNTTQGTFSPYGNLWSNYFNGSNAFLTAPASSNWTISSGSTFSVETWVCVNNTSAQSALCGALNRWWLGANFTDVSGTAGKFNFAVFNGSSWQTISSATSVVAGTWYHVAATFSSGTTKLYINGNLESSTTGVSTNSYSGSLFMGAILNPGYSYGLTGYLSNISITTGGTLPYTSNFTPSTTPLTATSNTVLLTCQNNRFVDNSTNAYTISVTGSPSVQRFSPFNPTSAYSASVIGGSGYFDGSGDYLTAVTNAAFNFGSGAFTIETFFYTSSTSNQVIVSGWNGSGSGDDSTSSFEMIYYSGTFYLQVASGSSSVPLTTSTWPLNQWNHAVLVANGSTMSAYVNGTRVATMSFSSAVNNTVYAPQIGARAGSSSYPFLGYISNTRIVKGTAVYDPTQTTLTVPTAPLTSISGTSLLTSMTNAGIIDSAEMNDLETVGNAQISTSQYKYGSSSIYFNGTSSNQILTYQNTGLFDFTKPMTIECWFYAADVTTYAGIVQLYGGTQSWSTGSGIEYQFALYNGSLYWQWNNGGGTNSISSSSGIVTNTWIHTAATFDGTTTRLFINGNLVGSSTNSYTMPSTRNIFQIGNNGTTSALNGYIDDLRVTSGYARYVQNFTPPTAALPLY